jgi:hypothetical protein
MWTMARFERKVTLEGTRRGEDEDKKKAEAP